MTGDRIGPDPAGMLMDVDRGEIGRDLEVRIEFEQPRRQRRVQLRLEFGATLRVDRLQPPASGVLEALQMPLQPGEFVIEQFVA